MDVSRRVAALEVALGAGRSDGAEDERDVRSELEAAREAVRHLHLENRALRADVQGAFERARAETDEKIAAMKAGFKSVLQDVVDRVASQLDAARKSEFDRAGRYASAAELAALSERVASHESARDASPPMRSDASTTSPPIATSRNDAWRSSSRTTTTSSPNPTAPRDESMDLNRHLIPVRVEPTRRSKRSRAVSTNKPRRRPAPRAIRNLSAELDAARRKTKDSRPVPKRARPTPCPTPCPTPSDTHTSSRNARATWSRPVRARWAARRAASARRTRRTPERTRRTRRTRRLLRWYILVSARTRERRGASPRAGSRRRRGNDRARRRRQAGARSGGGGFRPLLGEDEAARRRHGGAAG